MTSPARAYDGAVSLSPPGSPTPAAPPRDFRLSHAAPLTAEVQRVLTEQLGYCEHLLRFEPDPDRTVHEMRKSMKRSRAVLRLVRGELGRFRYRQENAVLRDLARRWAPARDGVVLATVARELSAGAGLADDGQCRRLVGTLEHRAAATRTAYGADRQLHLDTLTTLLAQKSRVERFPADGVGFGDSFDSLRPGLLRVAARATREMHRARREPTTEHLHQWRKRVKYLGHQLTLLDAAWDQTCAEHAERLDELGTVLGDEHDRAVLVTLLRAEPALLPGPRLREQLLGAIDRQRRDLQEEAFGLGASVLSDPQDVVDRLAAGWRSPAPDA